MEIVEQRQPDLLGNGLRILKSVGQSFLGTLKTITSDRLGALGLILLVGFALVALFAPWLAPYKPFDVMYRANGAVLRLDPPSSAHWLGTNNIGYDVFSQLILGFPTAFAVGGLSALGSVLIGTNVGLISGYFGGWVDQILMRLTDVCFGIPFLPFALILLAVAGSSLQNVILVIVLFLWRTTARVVRSQTLSLKERPFILAARAAGASHLRIIYLHIGPNVLPLTFLYVALGVASGVLLEAALSFLGFGDPLTPTWGQMLNGAFASGATRQAWWWVLPPGIALSLFVVATYMVTRAYEEVINPRLRERY